MSFLRRMAQGRLDLIHAYLDRRARSEINDMRAFVDDLPSIMAAGPPARSGPARTSGTRLPEAHPEDLVVELDAVLGADKMSELESLEDAELECHRRRAGRDGAPDITPAPRSSRGDRPDSRPRS